MKTKWTNGPWEIDPNPEYPLAVIQVEAGEQICGEFGDPAFPHVLANARLIAASPEMAELLERIAEDIVNQPEHRAEARALLARITKE